MRSYLLYYNCSKGRGNLKARPRAEYVMCTKSYKASRDFSELASTGEKLNANLEIRKGERPMRRFPTGFA